MSTDVTPRTSPGRIALGAIGVAMIGFGGWSLGGSHDPVNLLVWLIGGVVVHDAVLAPLTILVTAIGLRVVPTRSRRRLTLALIVLGTVTVTAIPVLSGRGRHPENPTLLDRNYTVGWLVFAGLVLVVTLLWSLAPLARQSLRRRR